MNRSMICRENPHNDGSGEGPRRELAGRGGAVQRDQAETECECEHHCQHAGGVQRERQGPAQRRQGHRQPTDQHQNR